MTTAPRKTTMDKVMGKEGRNATLVESSPNPFMKAAEVAIRSKNKKKCYNKQRFSRRKSKEQRWERTTTRRMQRRGYKPHKRMNDAEARNKEGGGQTR